MAKFVELTQPNGKKRWVNLDIACELASGDHFGHEEEMTAVIWGIRPLVNPVNGEEYDHEVVSYFKEPPHVVAALANGGSK